MRNGIIFDFYLGLPHVHSSFNRENTVRTESENALNLQIQAVVVMVAARARKIHGLNMKNMLNRTGRK